MLFTKYRNCLVKSKRMLAAVLAGCLLTSCLAGCGKSGKDAADVDVEMQDVKQSTSQVPGQEPSLGRYVETEFSYGEDCMLNQGKQILPWGDGLYLADTMGVGARADLTAKTISTDEEACPEALRKRFEADNYLTDMVVAENGARMYTVFTRADQDGWYYEKYYLSPDGTETPWDTVPKEDSAFMYYGRDGYFYVTKWSSETTMVYRVNSEDGETEFLFEVDGKVGYLSRGGNCLLLDTRDALKIYDLDTREELEEDKCLSDLLSGSLGDSNGNISYGYLLCPGEEDSIYVVTKKGLYRHVLYGSVAEQLIDGSLCSLSDNTWLVDMYVTGTAEEMPVFYLMFEDRRLVQFAYDAQVPSMPENMITVYSLYEDMNIQMVISAYRVQYPQVYVRYEIGITGDDGVTREDALRNLATALAAGEGPDVLLLDDLPYNSYADKGVLMDLSALYEGLQGEYNYFDNIINALRHKDALYTIPLGFTVPVLIGDKDNLSGIQSAEDMVSAFKEAKAPKGGTKVGLVDAPTVLQSLMFNYGNHFTKEDGSLDREAVTKFIELGKQVYEIDRENLTPEEIAERDRIWNRWGDLELGSTRRSNQMYSISKGAESTAQGMMMYGDCFGIGTLGGGIKGSINPFLATLECGKLDYMLLPGEGQAAFPMTMFGINAASKSSEHAQEFVRYALGDWIDEMYWAIPINRDAVVKMEENPYKDDKGNPSYEPYVWMSSSIRNEDGSAGPGVSIEVKWCKPEVYEAFNNMLDSIDTVSNCEYMLRDTVLEEGAKALTGEQSIEESVNAIERKLQLYLAE